MQIRLKIRTIVVGLATMLGIAACGPTVPPPPTLPEGTAVQNFIHNRELMQRQLNVIGPPNIVIPARVFNVRYTLSCLNETDGRSGRSRFNEAASLINEKMPRFVEGSTRSNPFYRIRWPASTNRLIVEQTGCEAKKVEWITLSEGRANALKWVVDNGLTQELILYSRGLN